VEHLPSETVVISSSVVIAAFNRASVIGDALSSVHAQTRAPIETIVVDDASTDITAELAEHEGARVIRLWQNRDAARARNDGIRAAPGR
jgi:glycosyltransferase involved in cell wall biosynthesis